MKISMSLDRIVCFFLALGVCFIFEIGDYRVGNYLIQQFVIIVPSLFLLFNYIIIKKRNSLHTSLLLLIMGSVMIFLITSFRFGIEASDFLSFMGFLILPIMVILFNNIDHKDTFLHYYILMFTTLEIIAIIWLVKEKAIFNIWGTVKLRELFYSWPNHFSMLSTIKYGSLSILKRKGTYYKGIKILSLTSICTIFLSLSRTGIFMFFIIFIINNLSTHLSRDRRIELHKKVGFIVILLILIVIANNAIGSKNLSAGSTTERTITSRLNAWSDIIEIIKDNIIFGTGFRSTIKLIRGNLSSIHNDYIDFLLKGGIIGFIIIYQFFLNRIIILLKKKEYEILSVIIAILAGSFVQNPLKNISIMVIFAFMLSYSFNIINDD